jgi:chemotaxis protein MotB
MFDRKIKNVMLCISLLALVAMAGCSCKEYEEQIMQLDAQVAELQQDLSDRDSAISEREQVAEDLRQNLADCQGDNAVLVEESEEVVMITVNDNLGFSASQVIVLDTMVPTLNAIAETIGQHPSWDVFVEGFTDDLGVLEEYQDQYPSNWELGAFRSSAVVRYMTGQMGLDPSRFAAVSYGEFRPRADNDTEEGRAQNRMVRFVLHKNEM